MPNSQSGDQNAFPADAYQRGSGLFCAEPDDLLSREACLLIGDILRPWLELHKIAPLELVTQKELMTKLKDGSAGTYQSSVYVAAQKQCEQAGGDVSARHTELEAFLSGYLDFVSNVGEEETPFDPERVDRSYRRLLQTEGPDIGRRRQMVAICRHIGASPSWGTKTERLVRILENCEEEYTVSLVDEILADTLAMDAAFDDSFEDEEDPFALIQDLMGLINSQQQPRRGACKLIKRLTKQMAGRNLRHTRRSLERSFMRLISQQGPINSTRKLTGNKQLLWELREFSKVQKKMLASGGWFTSDRVQDAMFIQAARRTGDVQLENYVARETGIFNKVLEFLRIYPFVYGPKNLARIEEKIFQALIRKDLNHLLDQSARSPMDQLAQYGILEQKLRKTTLPRGDVRDMVTNLGEQQEEFIREKKVFHKFRYLRASTEEKGVYVLQMLTLGAFTSGRCRRAAIKLLLHFLPSRQRMMEAAEAVTSADEDEDRSEELCSMYDYFIQGLDEQD